MLYLQFQIPVCLTQGLVKTQHSYVKVVGRFFFGYGTDKIVTEIRLRLNIYARNIYIYIYRL